MARHPCEDCGGDDRAGVSNSESIDPAWAVPSRTTRTRAEISRITILHVTAQSSVSGDREPGLGFSLTASSFDGYGPLPIPVMRVPFGVPRGLPVQ